MTESWFGAGAITAMSGVILGGLISEVTRVRLRWANRRRLKATVKHDLRAIWGRLYPGVRKFMDEAADDAQSKTYRAQLPKITITQNYFACFDAIAGEIAVLPNSELSQEIFDTYILARGTVDTLKTNSELLPGDAKIAYGPVVYNDLLNLKNRIETLVEKL